jgi:GNAT superfamily N-acetyltransferase
MVATIVYKVLTGAELYNYLIDYNNDDHMYKFSEIKERIKYFVINDIVADFGNGEHYFFIAIEDDKIVGMLKLKTGGNDSFRYADYKNWICSCCVDKEYQGQGISSELSKMMFEFAKEKDLNILTSGYTQQGFEKLKPMFKRYAQLYNVDFKDDRNKVEYFD